MNLIEEFNDTFPRLVSAHEGHAQLTEKTCDVAKKVYEISNPKNILEIGFNAGHTAFMWLTMFPDVKYHSVDICFHPYTMSHMKKLKEIFGDRFGYGKGDSKNLNLNFVKKFDFVFIDGSHEEEGIQKDYNLCNLAEVEWILIDDYMLRSSVKNLVDHIVSSPNHPYELVAKLEYDERTDTAIQVLLKRITDEKI